MNTEQNIKKKLLFRSNHRGTKELDLLIGGFTAHYIDNFTKQEINDLEELLKENDVDLYNWITLKEPIPLHYQNNLMQKLQNFRIYANTLS